MSTRTSTRRFFGPTADGARLRNLALPLLAVVVVFGVIIFLVTRSYTTQDNRRPETLYYLLEIDHLTSGPADESFDVTPGHTTQDVPFTRDGAPVLCTVTTGQRPSAVRAVCRPGS